MPNAFMQTINGEWFDDFVYTAIEPLKQRGYNIVKLDGEFGSTVPLINDICVGSVEFTSEFFRLLGIEEPKPIGYPKELSEFFARKIDKRLLSSITFSWN